ncbi:hypothetical protein CDD81_188 [Ophiocordyceps australis]|uniref:Phospholipase A2 domain-containing protein n=1 Tax=Ophiocordyceps australis TaxID=1399860 RepID=A0A2C5Y9F4_9HYPO|nr:hypothetical protein CDD81_188 [Ophiocordyceps australis]
MCLTEQERHTLSPEEHVDKLCFVCNLEQFDVEWNSPSRDPSFEWWTDGCTFSPNSPLGFDYLESCRRHDFCYHTLHQQGRFYPEVKIATDEVFFDE